MLAYESLAPVSQGVHLPTIDGMSGEDGEVSMNAPEFSPLFTSSYPFQLSPDGLHVAILDGSHLEIRQVGSLEVVRSVNFPNPPAKVLAIKWAPCSKELGRSGRFLLADEDTIRVWDMKDAQWTATVDNGSGSLGRIANVEFGNSDSEILVFSGFGGLLTVWSLLTGRTIEIKDAKFTTKGYDQSRSTNSAIFALLTRPAAQDIITLHASNSYAVLKSYILPTSDAQGLKWSPNGRWLAVWDTPANGIKIHIYTADGNLYRTYVGGDHVDELVGLGVKSIEWSSDGEYLVVAGHEKDIVLLSTRTFCVAVRLTYKSTLRPDSVCIWQEQPTLSTSRSYATATKPIILSTAHAPAPENRPSFGASIMTFNSGSSLLATKDDNMPTTVWIWDLALMKLRVAIIQNSVVKRLSWHPKKRNLLLIQTSQPEANLHIWDADVNQPHIIAHPSSLRLGNKAEAEWAVGGQQITPTIIYGGADGCVFAWPEGRRFRHGVTTQHEDPEVASDEEDSLYAILSGQESTPKADDTQAITEGAVDFPLEDTFQFRKDIGVH